MICDTSVYIQHWPTRTTAKGGGKDDTDDDTDVGADYSIFRVSKLWIYFVQQ